MQEHKALTLGSLFDGSGGFPLGGLLAGITPIWASEIAPFPIRVTTKRIPSMKHYGDISRMDGGKIEPVDIITFGSPCTDMSIAGKRAGLDGKQSSLFHEAIRIIREMREATNGKYPRYCVWENVVGAYSSNGGNDFKAVLEAVIGIVESGAEVPPPEKNRWPYADCYVGDGWSVAYRTFDAQRWGVPQRRKRIYLVADFAGECAGKILFESEGLSGYSAESFRAWQRAAGSAEACSGTSGGICLNDQGGTQMDISEDVTGTLRAEAHGHPPCVIQAYGICSKDSNSMRSDNPHSGIYEADTARTLDANGGSPTCNQGGIAVVESYAIQGSMICRMEKNGLQGNGINKDVSFTLNTADRHAVYAAATGHMQVEKEKRPTLAARDAYAVRKLTPTECARLQGFPDWWCADLETPDPTEDDIAFWSEVWETHRRIVGSSSKAKTRNQIIKWLKNPHSDSAEYKMWGNGVALPCVFFVLVGIVYYSQFSDFLL